MGCLPRTWTLFAAACVGLVAAAGTAGAAGSPTLAGELRSAMDRAGPTSSAYVYDLTAGRLLFADRSSATRPPASVEKLYTTVTALQRLGPDARFTTAVLGTGFKDQAGVWHGNLYLRGGGDPTFGTTGFIRSAYGTGNGASVSTLVGQLSAAGITRVDGRVVGDESLFDARRGGPRTGYRPDGDVEGTLSALAFNRGEEGHQRGTHAPAGFAAQSLAAALRKAGIVVRDGSAAGLTPGEATPLASVQSPPLRTLLTLMLPPSDNFFAEMLLKDLGARFGAGGTTSAGAAVVRRTIATLGIHPTIVDGSGLSSDDRTSPQQVTTLLRKLSVQPLGQLLRDSLPVAGRSGTLAARMRRTPAAGRCQAKTGTLVAVSDLAGWCDTAGGDTIVFAILMDHVSVSAAHLLQDNMTISIARLPTPLAPLTPPTQPGGTGTTGPTGPSGPTGAIGPTGASGP